MNYFAPANNDKQFSSNNRRNEHAYEDRDSRFRGGFRERDRDRGRGRGGDRRGRGSDFGRIAAQLQPPRDSELYAEADKRDPSTIDYSFYDMPVKIHHGRDQPDVQPYKEFEEFMEEMPETLRNNIRRMKY